MEFLVFLDTLGLYYWKELVLLGLLSLRGYLGLFLLLFLL
jgi:hypothetical protein